MNPKLLADVEDRLLVSHDDTYKEVIFKDGSKLRVEVSFAGATSTCGTGYCIYRDVEVSRWDGAIWGSFLTSYTIVYGQSNMDSITSVYNKDVTTLGMDRSNEYFGVDWQNETYQYAAQATLRFDYKYSYPPYLSSSWTLRFYVGKDMAWQQ